MIGGVSHVVEMLSERARTLASRLLGRSFSGRGADELAALVDDASGLGEADGLDEGDEEDGGLDSILGGAASEGSPLGASLLGASSREEALTERELQRVRELVVSILEEDEEARREELREAQEARLYLRGEQFGYFDEAAGAYRSLADELEERDEGDEDEPIPLNIVAPHCWYIVAVLSGGTAVTRFYPGDAARAEDVRGAKAANAVVEYFRRTNRSEDLEAQLAYLFFLDGTVAAYVSHQPSGRLFGYRDEPIEVEEEREVEKESYRCSECGTTTPVEGAPGACTSCGKPFDPLARIPAIVAKVPVVVGTRRVANSGEVVRLIPVTERRISPDADDLSSAEYFDWTTEVHPSRLKALYGKKARLLDTMRPGSSGSFEEEEREIRLTLRGGRKKDDTGRAPDRVTFHRTWLRPIAFYRLEDEDRSLRKKLLKLFPEGLFLAWTGELVLDVGKESMDETLAIGFAYPGEGQRRETLRGGLHDIQDGVNELYNSELSVATRSVSPSFYDQEVLDGEAYSATRLRGGLFYPVERRGGESIAASFHTPDSPKVSEQTVRLRQELVGTLSQFSTGAHAAMFGASDPNQRTASGLRMLRDQALGRMGLPWRGMKGFLARVDELAVASFVRSREEEEGDLVYAKRSPSGGFLNVVVSKGDLEEGTYHAFAESDETYPITAADRRETYQALLNHPDPNVRAAAFHPDNFDALKGALGWTGIVLPGEKARQKQLQEIEKLLKGTPVPGEDGSFHASIPIDPLLDDHASELEAGRSWAATEAGILSKGEGEVFAPGYINVWLHLRDHQMALLQQQAGGMPGMEGMGGVAPGEGAPPGDPSAAGNVPAPGPQGPPSSTENAGDTGGAIGAMSGAGGGANATGGPSGGASGAGPSAGSRPPTGEETTGGLDA